MKKDLPAHVDIHKNYHLSSQQKQYKSSFPYCILPKAQVLWLTVHLTCFLTWYNEYTYMLNTITDIYTIFISDQSQNWSKTLLYLMGSKSVKHHWAIWLIVTNFLFWKVFAFFPSVTSPEPVLENWDVQIFLYYCY